MQIISEFEKLHKTDFENNLEKVDELKKTAIAKKERLEIFENTVISLSKAFAEKVRLDISVINAMLFTIDKVKQYMIDNCPTSEKQKIKEKLLCEAGYYPEVRSLVKEVVGLGTDLSTSSGSGSSSEEKEKEDVAVDGENITNFSALNEGFSKTKEDVKLIGKKKEISKDEKK